MSVRLTFRVLRFRRRNSEPVFQILDLHGDRTGRNTELPRRRREASCLCDLHEGGYAGHTIHEITPPVPAARCLHVSFNVGFRFEPNSICYP